MYHAPDYCRGCNNACIRESNEAAVHALLRSRWGGAREDQRRARREPYPVPRAEGNGWINATMELGAKKRGHDETPKQHRCKVRDSGADCKRPISYDSVQSCDQKWVN